MQRWDDPPAVSIPENVRLAAVTQYQLIESQAETFYEFGRSCARAGAFVAQQAFDEIAQRLEDIRSDIATVVGSGTEPETESVA